MQLRGIFTNEKMKNWKKTQHTVYDDICYPWCNYAHLKENAEENVKFSSITITKNLWIYIFNNINFSICDWSLHCTWCSVKEFPLPISQDEGQRHI